MMGIGIADRGGFELKVQLTAALILATASRTAFAWPLERKALLKLQASLII
jgi:hypothetical protein